MITAEQAMLLTMSETEAQAYIESIRAEIICKEMLKGINERLFLKRALAANFGLGVYKQFQDYRKKQEATNDIRGL